MGSSTHFSGKGFTPAHTSVTDGAKPIVETLRRWYGELRITNDIITAGIGARCFSVKFTKESGALRMTVVTNGAKQEFYLYGAPPPHEIVERLRADKDIGRRYIIKA